MKKINLYIIFMVLLTQNAWSNNVQVSNVRLTGQNTTDDFTMVEFDINWENSWRYNGGPNNWDAAWVFIKYRVGIAGAWQHAWLNNTGHISCASTTIENGLLTPSSSFNPTTNPVLGVFLYRSTAGSGNFSCQDVQLRWNYGINGVADNEEIDIRVFALEMVYIPQGSFYVGSGGNESGAFYTYPTTTSSYQIMSEGAINVGPTNGNLYYPNTSGTSGDQSGPIPALYPKGFVAFYAMKYELSQKAYVDFLNTLTRAQQINRVRSNITGTTPSFLYVMSDDFVPQARNGIRCLGSIPPSPGVVEFFCDLNQNNLPNENGDGLGIPSNYMLSSDISAYLDWACLRFMTEFEFEKCGRGPKQPFPNEYAWGTLLLYKNGSLVNSGQPSEAAGEYYANSPYDLGPLRNGCFARSNSTRELAGASYYGILDLSGNILEIGVSVGSPGSRAYTGVHGNGILSAIGNGDPEFWPGNTGLFMRGGTYFTTEITQERLSDRQKASSSFSALPDTGLRGVRTAQ